jgi:hypothetical protein
MSVFFKLVKEFFYCHPRLLIVAIVATALIYYAYRSNSSWNDAVSSKVTALRSATFDLFRLMETTKDGVNKKWDGLSDRWYRFAFEGPALVANAFDGRASVQSESSGGGSPRIQTSNIVRLPDDIITRGCSAGESIVDRWLDDKKGFGPKWSAVSQGVATYLAIMQHDNLSNAHYIMTEYMKTQRNDEKKSLPNFGELKKFLGLPTKWPEGDEPEKLQSAGLSDYERKLITEALPEGKKKVAGLLRTLVDLDKSDRGAEEVRNGALMGMRDYIRDPSGFKPRWPETA